MLLQASSFSHYSWHILARSASADGHGDLKGYLDERSPGFDYLGPQRHAAGYRLVLRLRPIGDARHVRVHARRDDRLRLRRCPFRSPSMRPPSIRSPAKYSI